MQATYLIFGGTGSLGKALIDTLFTSNAGLKGRVAVFSRDESKHHKLKLKYPDIISIVGDVRDYNAVRDAFFSCCPRFVIQAAAMKQVPLCEENPHEAILTNIIGSENVAKVSAEYSRIYPTRRIKILSISTDKSCKPVNLYGMTKAIQERIHLKGNNGKSNIHNCVRYGNVLESTGSVIPIFKERINSDLNLNVTHNQMTRFLLSLAEAVDLIFKALNDEDGGKIFIPKIKSAKIYDVAEMLIKVSGKKLQIVETGIRPGEKIHEILISEEELTRTEDSGDVYIVHDIFSTKSFTSSPQKEYSSEDDLLDLGEIEEFLRKKHVI